MNTHIFSIIFISIIIATLIVAICNIFAKGIIFIAKVIANEDSIVNFKSNLITIMICTFIICIHFLI